jgi:hypothetical protein
MRDPKPRARITREARLGERSWQPIASAMVTALNAFKRFDSVLSQI